MLEKPGDVVCVITVLPPAVASSVTVGHCPKQDINLAQPTALVLSPYGDSPGFARRHRRVNLLNTTDGGRGWNHDSGL